MTGWRQDALEFRRMAVAEGAELVDEVAGVVAGLENLLERLVGGMFFGQVHGHEFGAAEDAGDEVVEFVGDAAGQLVEGVEFLGLQELVPGVQPRLFQLDAVGDVHQPALHGGLLAVAGGLSLFPDGAPTAVGVAHAVFNGEGAVFGDGGLDDVQHLVAVVRMDERGEREGFAFGLQAEQRMAAGAGELNGAGAVGAAEIGHAGQAVKERAVQMSAGQEGTDFGFQFPAGVIGVKGGV